MSYMREHNVGRASFIVLDQMSEWRARMAKPFEAPAATHRLFDLVTPQHADLKPAFYMALKVRTDICTLFLYDIIASTLLYRTNIR